MMRMNVRRTPGGRSARRAQAGVSLLVVLMVLTAMLVGAVALMRSTQTATTIAGNVAFRQQALASTDFGLYAAAEMIVNLRDPDAAQAGYNPVYNRLGDEANGLPDINWDQQPTLPAVGNFTVRYHVQRMCDVTPVTQRGQQCLLYSPPAAGSNRIGSTPIPGPSAVFYRITVRAIGVRDTESFVQSMVTR